MIEVIDPTAEQVVDFVAAWMGAKARLDAALAVKKAVRKPRQARPPRTRRHIPEDWRPSKMLTLQGEQELKKFRNWHIAKGNQFADIERAFRNWLDDKGGTFFAEPLASKPPATQQGQVYVPFSDRDAWDAYGREHGIRYPRDKNGGWYFPSAMPPTESGDA